MKCSDFYNTYCKEMQKLISEKNSQHLKNFHDLLRNELARTGAETVFRNKVYEALGRIRQQTYRSWLHDPIDYIRKAKITWERRFHKPLSNLCFDLGIPFERKRNTTEQKEIDSRWCDLGTEEFDSSLVKPVYAPKDLLETLIRLRSPNQRLHNDKSTKWRVIHLSLASTNFQILKKHFEKVITGSINIALVEISMELTDEHQQLLKLLYDERIRDSHQICRWNYVPLSRAFCLGGCSRGFRGQYWSQMLGVHIGPKEKIYYENLKTSVLEIDYMIDRLIIKDVKLTSSNDEQYFVFEEYLYQVMLLFSRDIHIFYHSSTGHKSSNDGYSSAWKEGVYPPNGIIPFHGFTMLACPLCYIYDDPIALYFVFKELYSRYFFHLHTISSHTYGILRLSCLFEHLLATTEPELCSQFDIHGVQPLRCVFKWIMRAFSGYLPTPQVLILWDQIIAFDDIEILPVVAVAVLHFRKGILLQSQSQDEIEAVLSDLSSISVIPVLHEYLTSTD
ncbi:hypothetical protein CHUAL_001630 [Chamberlinius hualienensis]